MAQNPAAKAIERLAKRENADIFLYNAAMQALRVDRFRSIVGEKKNRAENCILFLTTYGGDADAAYRLAACLRRHYAKVSAFVFGQCKSAGTLAVLGADEVIFGDFGELGPLDVQMTKPDELMSTSSGLDIFQAMGVLTNSAFEAFEAYFIGIIEHSQGHISAKTSAEIARELAVGLFAPMTEQIDPERLGEVQRAITVANAYGNKLNQGNLKKGALEKLVQGYPTHGFVVDIEEAKTLFVKVRKADQLECQVAGFLPNLRRQQTEPVVADVRSLFETSKGASNAKPKTAANRSRRAVSGSGQGRATNVAQLKRDTAGNSPSSEKDDNARGGQPKTIRPSIRPPGTSGEAV